MESGSVASKERTPASAEQPAASRSRQISAILIVALGTCIVLANWLIGALHSGATGWDFPVFYIAAKLPMTQLYDAQAFAAVWQHQLAPLGVPHWAAYVRPSFFAVLLHPLAHVYYTHALWSWMLAALCLYLGSVALLIRQWHLPLFLMPACAAFFPGMAGIVGGQDAALYLFCFTLAILLLRRKLDLLAGAVLVVCLCKFNLAMLVPLPLLAHRRPRALLAFLTGAVVIAAVSLRLTPLADYTAAIARAQRETSGFFPVGLRGFSVAIGQPWCYPILAAAVAILCCWLIFKLPLAESMAMAITGALLISPYITYYDSTLLLIPLALIISRAGFYLRLAVFGAIVAVPLWQHGGGSSGPIGFMHVAVELFIVGFYVHQVTRATAKTDAAPELAAGLA
jgi:hypothetical protein